MTPARFRTIRFVAALAVAAALVLSASDRQPASAQAKKPPRLIVIVVVDQMRADYLEWYRKNYTSGFDRLLREGAVYTDAAYPYLNTITCAGHSTIGTGTFPYRHGMIMNNWFDRQTGKTPYCTDDPTMTEISS
jgi:predicted AlkP superfamily pyrophosphatase or phosphodiesterase